MNGFCMIGTSVRKELNVEDDFQGRLYSYCASFCLLLIKTSIYSSYLKYSLFQRIFSVPFAFINHFVPLLIPLLYSARHFRNQTNKQRKYFIVFFFHLQHLHSCEVSDPYALGKYHCLKACVKISYFYDPVTNYLLR